MTETEYLVLADLNLDGPATAYAVWRRNKERINLMTTYRAVKMFAATGAVDVVEVRTHRNGMPMPVYRITDSGWAALVAESRRIRQLADMVECRA